LSLFFFFFFWFRTRPIVWLLGASPFPLPPFPSFRSLHCVVERLWFWCHWSVVFLPSPPCPFLCRKIFSLSFPFLTPSCHFPQSCVRSGKSCVCHFFFYPRLCFGSFCLFFTILLPTLAVKARVCHIFSPGCSLPPASEMRTFFLHRYPSPVFFFLAFSLHRFLIIFSLPEGSFETPLWPPLFFDPRHRFLHFSPPPVFVFLIGIFPPTVRLIHVADKNDSLFLLFLKVPAGGFLSCLSSDIFGNGQVDP